MRRLRARLHLQLAGDPSGDGKLSLLSWILVATISAALATSILSTEPLVADRAPQVFHGLEVAFGIIFSIEYLIRLWTAAEARGSETSWVKRRKFVFSLLGIIDLLVIMTSLTPLFTANFAILRSLRLARLFAFAKFGRFSEAFRELASAVYERRFELYVTMALASVLLLIGATSLYLLEGAVQPDKFGSIPRALWWSIITLTTVGYGDVAPITPMGKFAAAIVALAGIGLVAMPTGIMAAAFSEAMQRRRRD